MVHNHVMPFVCEGCQKRFRQKGALKQHLVVHYEPCPFQCEVCGARFNRVSHLKRHLVTHQASVVPARPDVIKPEHSQSNRIVEARDEEDEDCNDEGDDVIIVDQS